MKKLITIMLLVVAFTGGYSQGFENFDNFPATGTSYQDGTFIGQDGSEWTYVQCRGDYEITDKAIMIGRNRTPQSNFYSGTISGGIGTLNFDYSQAFSTNVNLDVLINDVVVGNVTSNGEQGIIKNSGDIFVDISGDFVIQFINVNNSDGQVVVDNVQWTAVAGNTVATPQFSPTSGTFFDPFDLEITCSTPDATIYYTNDGTDPDQNSTQYTSPIFIDEAVVIKARAYAPGLDPSNIATGNYSFFEIEEVANLAELRAAFGSGADYYKVTGEVWLTYQQAFRNQKYIQDASGAILIDDAPNGNFNPGVITTEYQIGDGITGLIGTLSEFGGMLQYVPAMDPGEATSSGNFPEPVVVTINDLFTDFETYESRLVRLNTITFADGGSLFENGMVYAMADGSKAEGNFRTTFFDVDYIGTEIPVGATDIVGLPNSRTDGDYFTSRYLADFNVDNQVAAPTFDPPGGDYDTPIEVSIQCETPDVMIYYTTDGSDPDQSSTLYAAPVAIDVTTTLKARAYADGLVPSAIATAQYNLPAGEPSEYPADFAAEAVLQTIILSWADAAGETLPEAYLIKASSTDNITTPVDGEPVEDDPNLADGTAAMNIAYGVETYTFTNLNEGTDYYFKIFPYTNSGTQINYKTDGTPPAASATIETGYTDLLFTTFDDSWENWEQISITGDQIWDRDNTFGIDDTPCAKMSGFEGGTSYFNEDWLISPSIEVGTDWEEEQLVFHSAVGFSGLPLMVKISTDYDGQGDPYAATWTDLTEQAIWPEPEPFWQWTNSGIIDIEQFAENTIHVAFVYESNDQEAATWEVDDITVRGKYVVGVDDMAAKVQTTIYPNPGNGIFTIQSETPISQIEVVALTGSVVYRAEIKETIHQINLSHLEQGVYFIRIKDEMTNSISNQKLIIQ
jgi:hypothetical protein